MDAPSQEAHFQGHAVIGQDKAHHCHHLQLHLCATNPSCTNSSYTSSSYTTPRSTSSTCTNPSCSNSSCNGSKRCLLPFHSASHFNLHRLLPQRSEEKVLNHSLFSVSLTTKDAETQISQTSCCACVTCPRSNFRGVRFEDWQSIQAFWFVWRFLSATFHFLALTWLNQCLSEQQFCINFSKFNFRLQSGHKRHEILNILFSRMIRGSIDLGIHYANEPGLDFPQNSILNA